MINLSKFLARITNTLLPVLFAALVMGGALRFMLGISQESYYLYCTALLMLCSCLKLLVQRPSFNVPVLVYVTSVLGWAIWLGISVLWTNSPQQYQSDLVLIAGILVTTLLLVIGFGPVFPKRLFVYCVFFTSIISLFVIYQSGGVIGIKGYGTLVDEFYLTAGRAIAIGYITCLVQFLFANKNTVIWTMLAMLHLVALAVSLARGPLVFSVFIVLLLIGLGARARGPKLWLNKRVFKRYFSFLVPVILGTVFLAFQVESTRTRLVRMANISIELSEGGRGLIWQEALNNIAQAPLWGYGLGSSGLFSAHSEDLYPHNLFLQAWLDGGVIAFLLLVLVVMLPIIIFFGLRRKYETRISELIAAFSCYIYLLLEYSKSHSIYTARDFFLFGMVIVLYTLPNVLGQRAVNEG